MKLSLTHLIPLLLAPPTTALTSQRITELFAPLATGAPSTFYNTTVSPNVQWTILGTHRLAGLYTNRSDFLERGSAPVVAVIAPPFLIDVQHVTTDGTWAAVELATREGTKMRNGTPYDMTYTWVVRFEGQVIQEVRAYLDSALLEQALESGDA